MTQPQQEYIITEQQITELEACQFMTGGALNRFLKVIRSRPLSSEFKKMDIRTHTRGCLTCRSPTCPVWQAADQNYWVSEKEWLSSELKKERDDVCNEAIRAIKVIGMPFGTEALFIQTIESLRSEQP